jgi:hypothetical protein
MFIIYAVFLGLLLGFATGGRLLGLATLELRWPGAIVGGLLFQFALFWAPVAERIGDLGPPLYVISTLVVAAAVLRNWRITGIPLVVAGAACNLAAIFANGGYMPSTIGALDFAGKGIPTMYNNSAIVPDPNLWFLTDVFALPRGVPLANVFSVGDVLVGAGIMLAIVSAMHRRTGPVEAEPEALAG